MFELKPLDPGSVTKALEKAERYRLLNEPEEAESICLDVLAVEPENQTAVVMLLLALSDQFRTGCGDCFARARGLLSKLGGEYERCYYAGIICERRGAAHLDRGGPGSHSVAFTWMQEAMEWYEKAEALRPPNNDDAVLRWNTCVRVMAKHNLKPAPAEPFEPILQE
jgi:hypothetical protein